MKRGFRNTIKSSLGLCNAKHCYKRNEYKANIDHPLSGQTVTYVDLCKEHMDWFVEQCNLSRVGDVE